MVLGGQPHGDPCQLSLTKGQDSWGPIKTVLQRHPLSILSPLQSNSQGFLSVHQLAASKNGPPGGQSTQSHLCAKEGRFYGPSSAQARREPKASSRGWEKVGAVSPGLFYHSL